MNLITAYRSPNFDDREISIEYVVLHYTATTLARTLEIFTTPDRASSHLVIDRSGDVYELVPCLHGKALRAWHAGSSRLRTVGGEQIEGFNDRSIGIELVNLNGNVFPYTDQQYASLGGVLAELKSRYPALSSPDSIVGHEDVAGFRGKCDPGRCFDWPRLFAEAYSGQPAPVRTHVCTPASAALIQRVMDSLGITHGADKEVCIPAGIEASFFESFSQLIEHVSGSTAT